MSQTARLPQLTGARPQSQTIRQACAAPNSSIPGTKLISKRASAAVHSTKNQNPGCARGGSP